MSLSPSTTFAAACLLACASCVTGCGLTLDYGPPDPVLMDASVDAGAPTCETGCDDALRCTIDSCVDGACVHTSTCRDGLDCIARGGVGECRRPCDPMDPCSDGLDCTIDRCDTDDHHCAHTNRCTGARGACLASGICAPATCTADSECDDGNLCTGVESCVAGVCQGGVPVTCDPTPAGHCVSQQCDPHTGGCAPVVDITLCDDGFACTADLCAADFSCSNPPNDASCNGTNLCTQSVCDPSSTVHDASGCVVVVETDCEGPCAVPTDPVTCTPATGLCEYRCAAGQVCAGDGCEPEHSCTTDDECNGHSGPGGCPTRCTGGFCRPLECALHMGCGDLAVHDGCADTCAYVPNDDNCEDGDPLSHDTCSSDFTCAHDCGAASANDCVTYAWAGSCIPTLHSTTCTALHPGGGTRTNCARYTCVGHDHPDAMSDGCALSPIHAACADGASCTVETCELDLGTRTGNCTTAISADVDSICRDAQDCTVDACDPANARSSTTGCTHTPDDAVCSDAAGSLECGTARCAQTGTLANSIGPNTLPTGCAVEYRPAACLLNGICTLDAQCSDVRCAVLGANTCDDGVSCNGHETCLVGHCTQIAAVLGGCSMAGGCDEVCTLHGCLTPSTPVCGVAVD